MQGKFVGLMALIVILISCQREPVEKLEESNGLLVKTVQKSGADSVVTNYSYNGNGKLVRETITGMMGGTNRGSELRLDRNAFNILVKMVETAEYLKAGGVDSVSTRFNYNTSAGRYTSSVATTSGTAVAVIDSVSYLYDGSGKLIRDEHFQQVAGIPFTQTFKQEYVYTTSGNIDSVKQFSYDMSTGTYSLSSTVAYVYDNKVNPLQLSTEGLLIYRFLFFGSNNVVQTKGRLHTTPPVNYDSDLVFVYDTDNKPKTAVITETPPGRVSNITYYYN